MVMGGLLDVFTGIFDELLPLLGAGVDTGIEEVDLGNIALLLLLREGIEVGLGLVAVESSILALT